MNLELELHLEGPDANDDTLHDLLSWLEREDIPGLSVERKLGSPIKDKMGADMETVLLIVLSLQASIQSIPMIIDAVRRWKETREVETVVKPEIKRIDVQEELPGRDKIQALIEELKKQLLVQEGLDRDKIQALLEELEKQTRR
ncbi:MAG: hypothetical protein DRR19_24940 [Candidatus Parabeggiatoa sp. nov. 1]|nr:MAG: hypothetical protein DRR19_24940 [Gammaproteobacteria bacterium]